MKKTWIIVIGVIAVLAVICTTSYNSMVAMDEGVATAWSNVENQYQRRSDLIPNLVNTVKGYAAHEKDTLERVIQARNGAVSAKTIDEKIAAENQLSSALSGLKITL